MKRNDHYLLQNYWNTKSGRNPATAKKRLGGCEGLMTEIVHFRWTGGGFRLHSTFASAPVVLLTLWPVTVMKWDWPVMPGQWGQADNNSCAGLRIVTIVGHCFWRKPSSPPWQLLGLLSKLATQWGIQSQLRTVIPAGFLEGAILFVPS